MCIHRYVYVYMHTNTYIYFLTLSKIYRVAANAAEVRQIYARGSTEKKLREVYYTPKLTNR